MASGVVRQLVAGKGVLFPDCGGVALHGFEDPARLYEVRWREEMLGGQPASFVGPLYWMGTEYWIDEQE